MWVTSRLEAYGVFDKEARDVSPGWQPLTVNTDGREATRNAFTKLFPKIVLLLCFLHGFLKIRDRCRKYHDLHQLDRPHQSPAHRLNERSYHTNWLHNLQSSFCHPSDSPSARGGRGLENEDVGNDKALAQVV